MNIHHLSFEKTGYFSRLLSDYSARNSRIESFSRGFADVESILTRSSQPYPLAIDRKLLAETLRQQYEGFEISDLTSKNIECLALQNSRVVVTAHQLCWMGGPMYFMIKIANAVRLARELAEKDSSGLTFVPVYWMGSEDHDFEEVNHIRLFGKTISWEHAQGGAVGRYLTTEMEAALATVFEILGESENAVSLKALIEKAYAFPNMQMATRYLVNAVFGKYGLVIADGDDAVLKRAFAPVMAEELRSQCSLPLVEKQNEQLIQAGYHAQASARPINLFYLGDFNRLRIQASEGHLKAGENQAPLEWWMQELQSSPERFSPNVILRPLYQQSVLPAVAFVGGGGEIAYWLQLGLVFDHFKVHYPVLVPRTSLTYINKNQSQKLQKLNLEIEALFSDLDQLKKDYALENSTVDPDLSTEKQAIEKLMKNVREKAAQIDPTLEPVAGAEAQKMINALDHFQGRLLKALKQKQEQSLQQITHLHQQLFPDHSLQERQDNFMNIYLRMGDAFFEALIEQLQPGADQMVIWEEV